MPLHLIQETDGQQSLPCPETVQNQGREMTVEGSEKPSAVGAPHRDEESQESAEERS